MNDRDNDSLPPLPNGDEYSATRMLANGELAPRFTAASMQAYARAAIAADRAKLARQGQEPVAWMRRNSKECKSDIEKKHMETLEYGHWKEVAASYCIPLYLAAPASAQPAEDEILVLHRQLAAEKLRADQGWQRAEAKSRECIELRERIGGAQPDRGAAQDVSVIDYDNPVDKSAPHSQPVRGVPERMEQAKGHTQCKSMEEAYGNGVAAGWNGCLDAMLAALPQGSQVGGQWSKQPPTEQADYWHWDGDEDHAPMIYHVLWSGSANKCFVSIGQYDIREAIWCDKFGGWWMKIEQPRIPPLSTAPEGADGMGGAK